MWELDQKKRKGKAVSDQDRVVTWTHFLQYGGDKASQWALRGSGDTWNFREGRLKLESGRMLNMQDELGD